MENDISTWVYIYTYTCICIRMDPLVFYSRIRCPHFHMNCHHSKPKKIGRKFKSRVHPRKPTWNLKMKPWKRRFLLKTIILKFHVSFRGGIPQRYLVTHLPKSPGYRIVGNQLDLAEFQLHSSLGVRKMSL